MKYLTLRAIFDSALGFYQMRLRPLVTWKLAIVVCALSYFVLTGSIFNAYFEARDQKREAARETVRQTKELESDLYRESAQKATEQAAELERENLEIKAQADSLRRAVETISQQIRGSKIFNEKKRKELAETLEKITNADGLRARNCTERKRLGFACTDG